MKRREPTRDEIEDVLRTLTVHKRVKEASGPHAICDCPSCGKRKHLYVNTDNGLWDCKVCGEAGNLFQLANLTGTRVRPQAIVKGSAGQILKFGLNRYKSIGSIENLEKASKKLFNPDFEDGKKVLEYLRGRGLSNNTIEHFKLAASRMPSGKKQGPLAVAIPYIADGVLVNVKYRAIDPETKGQRFARHKGGASALFNEDAIRDQKAIVLVEGELDAISLWQMGVHNVASTSLGAKGSIPDEWRDSMAKATDIVLWYDQDETGRASAHHLVNELGAHRTRVAQPDLPSPDIDINDLVSDGADPEFFDNVIETAARKDPDHIKKISGLQSIVEAAISASEEDFRGIPTGWHSLDKVIGGWRPGEVTIVTGHTSHGKSTWLSAAVQHLAMEGHPVLMTALEDTPDRLCLKMINRALGFGVRNCAGNDRKMAYLRMKVQRLEESPTYILDCDGAQPLESILRAVEYSAKALGVKFVSLDHFDFIVPGGRQERDADWIKESMQSILSMAQKLGIHIFVVSHVRGDAKENWVCGGQHLKGGSGLKQTADNVISVFRDTDPVGNKGKIRSPAGGKLSELPGQLQSLIRVDKCRSDIGRTGYAILGFEPWSLRYLEPKEARVKENHEDDMSPIEPHNMSFFDDDDELDF